MTSTADEIANLRAALTDMLTWARQGAEEADTNDLWEVYREVACKAKCALKTPRASKVIPIRAPRPVPSDPQEAFLRGEHNP